MEKPVIKSCPNAPDFIQAHDREEAWEDRLEMAFEIVGEWLDRYGVTPAEALNLARTPQRAAKAFREANRPTHELFHAVNDIIATGFPTEDPSHLHSMVTVTGIRFSSTCPHHLYPVMYEAHMSYIPKVGGTVLGLSKLPRLAKTLAQRPVLHEQLARDIADVLHCDTASGAYQSRWPQIASEGSAVTLIGRHTCMACRGVEQDALTTVTELRGRFWERDMETKFYAAVSNAQNSRL